MVYEKLQAMRVAVERACLELEHPLPYLTEAFEALEREVVDVLPPPPPRKPSVMGDWARDELTKMITDRVGVLSDALLRDMARGKLQAKKLERRVDPPAIAWCDWSIKDLRKPVGDA